MPSHLSSCRREGKGETVVLYVLFFLKSTPQILAYVVMVLGCLVLGPFGAAVHCGFLDAFTEVFLQLGKKERVLSRTLKVF